MDIELYLSRLMGATVKAYYRFSAGALTTDSSGNSHTLTAVGTPTEDSGGKFGGAVAMDGSAAYTIVDHADLKPTTVFTVGLYIKSNGSVTDFLFQAYNNEDPNRAGWYLRTDGSGHAYFLSAKNTGSVAGTDYQVIISSKSVNDNLYHFVVGVWDGSFLRLYVDGIPDATAVPWTDAPAYAASTYPVIGAWYSGSTYYNYFAGSLDEVFLLNGLALSADEVLELSNPMRNKTLMGVGR